MLQISVHSSILAEQTDYFISQRCLGAEQRTLKKVFTVGQTVRVFVKNINGSKIALSMKFDDENPWNGATEKFAPGNIVKGKQPE